VIGGGEHSFHVVCDAVRRTVAAKILFTWRADDFLERPIHAAGANEYLTAVGV